MATYFDEDLWYGSSTQSEAEAEQKAAKSIAAKVGRILGAKPFPIAAQRLSELTRDPFCPMQVVVDVLETDPALSARLLRLVNSAGYSLRTSCTSVGHAAALVGIRKLNQIASTAAILDLYETHSAVAAATLEHAAVVGALCRYLAAHVGLPQDELFTCGFLHDIGKLMLLDSEGEEYAELLRVGMDEPDTVHIQERARFGYDHALLAGHVLSAWHIPAPVPKVVAWHHQVTRAYQEGTELGRMVSVVRLADAMSVALFRQFPDFEVERLARTEAASYLEISEPQIAAMWDEMFVLAQRARSTFRGEPAPEAEPTPVPLSHAPANDTLAEDSQPEDSTPHKQPKFFPCVVCGVPSYANLCKACNGYVCPEHQEPADEWCSMCMADYAELEVRLPPWIYALLGSAVGAMLVGTLVGAAGAVTGKPLQVMVAPGLLSLLAIVLMWSWQRFFRRLWFLRTCPDRKSMAPASDPSFTELPESSALSKRWINPFELNTKPGAREVHEELESLHPRRPPSSHPPARSERRVSLRPSRRDGNADLPIILSLPPQSLQIQYGDDVASAAKISAAREPLITPSKPAFELPKPKSQRGSRSKAPRANATPSERPSFRPSGRAPELELDAFDAPEPLVSQRPQALVPPPVSESIAPRSKRSKQPAPRTSARAKAADETLAAKDGPGSKRRPASSPAARGRSKAAPPLEQTELAAERKPRTRRTAEAGHSKAAPAPHSMAPENGAQPPRETLRSGIEQRATDEEAPAPKARRSRAARSLQPEAATPIPSSPSETPERAVARRRERPAAAETPSEVPATTPEAVSAARTPMEAVEPAAPPAAAWRTLAELPGPNDGW